MKLVPRNINGVTIGVDITKPNELFFEEEFVIKNPLISDIVSPADLCMAISPGNFTPLLMTWELLDKCSFSCSFCYIVGHSENKLIRFKDMKPHVNHLIELGLLYCTLTGGEATLHPDFIEIYTYLKKRGVIVEVYTNGSLITQEHIALFKKYPPYKIEISIYGMTQATFNHVAGTSKFSYHQILENILSLKESGANIICKTPVNKITEQEIYGIKDWCNKNDIKYYYSTDITNAYDGDNLSDFSADFSKKIQFEAEKLISIYTSEPEQFSKQQITSKTCYTCGIRNYGFHVNSKFALMPCSETHYPETTFEILKTGIDPALNKIREFVNAFTGKSISGCDGCEASLTCKMCAAKATIVRDDNGQIFDFKVPDNHCETQRSKSRAIAEYIMTSI